MGFSPGEFECEGISLHWEGKPNAIILWDRYEEKVILRLDASNARKALDQLSLIVEMLERGDL